jgi:Molybdopterin cofactor-binding domain
MPKDTGLGIATTFGQERNMPTRIACVSRVRVARSSGAVTVEKLTIVVDAGTVVDPDGALAQIEGAALWGLSMAIANRQFAGRSTRCVGTSSRCHRSCRRGSPHLRRGARAALLEQARAKLDKADTTLTQIKNEAIRQIVMAGNAVKTSLSAYSAATALAAAAQNVPNSRLEKSERMPQMTARSEAPYTRSTSKHAL